MTSSSRCRADRWATSTRRRSSTPTRSAPTAADRADRLVAGIVLAAGGGRRFGGPKALALTDGVPWVVRAVDVLRDAGVAPIVVVVGASADEVATLVTGTIVVRNDDWAAGMGGSLRVGLRAVGALDVEAVVVMLVDLPGVTAPMVRRLIAHDGDLLQASFGGVSGHPVLLGRAHWAEVATAAHGDRGARDYLRDHGAVRVPLGSAADGADVDTR